MLFSTEARTTHICESDAKLQQKDQPPLSSGSLDKESNLSKSSSRLGRRSRIRPTVVAVGRSHSNTTPPQANQSSSVPAKSDKVSAKINEKTGKCDILCSATNPCNLQ